MACRSATLSCAHIGYHPWFPSWLAACAFERDCKKKCGPTASPARGEAPDDLDGSDELDVTSAEALAAVIADLRARHIRVGLAHLHKSAAQLLRRAGTLGEGSAFARDDGCQVFPNLDAAVRWAHPGSAVPPG
ncbi:MAG TPA: hypothetical protein VGM12_03840 [Trebonia sp.]|jgi:MFS superfamily sulfate permease-like transporter